MRHTLLAATATFCAALPLAFYADSDADYDSANTMGYYVYSEDDPSATGANDFADPYLGLNLGVNASGMKYTDTIGSNSKAVNSTDLGFLGGLFGGFGKVFNEFYVGLDGNLRYSFGGSTHSAQITQGTSTTNIDEVSQTWSSGLGLKMGGIVYNTALIYVYGGGQYANFKFSELYNASGESVPNVNNSKFGLSAGLGVSVQMNRTLNWDMRYLYEHYATIDLNLSSVETLEVRPQNNIFLVGLSYHF